MTPTMRRVAVLTPKVTWDGATDKQRRAAEAWLWNQQLDVGMRCPGLSLAMPGELGGGLPLGLPTDAETQLEQTRRAFDVWRRDELVWLTVTLKPQSASITLHTLAADDRRQSFDAVGADVGAALTQLTTQWLAARGQPALPSPFESVQVAQLLAVLETIASFVKDDAPLTAGPPEGAMLKLVAAAASAEEEDSDDDEEDSDDDDEEDSDDDEEDSDDDEDDGGGFDEDLGQEVSDESRARLTSCLEQLGPRATWAAIRTAHALLGGAPQEPLESLDPTHPWVLWHNFSRQAAHDPDFELLRACQTAAPGWAAPALAAVIDEDELPEAETDDELAARPTSLEQIAGATFAVFANPTSHDTGTAASRALVDEGREAEALRLLRHRVDVFGNESAEHIELMRLHEETERIGDWVHEAREAAWRHGCPMEPGLPWFPDQILVDLGESDALMQAGRLEEATLLRANRLHGLAASWPRHTAILEKWKRSPRFVAWSYAREGAFRGDDARVVEGFGRAEPDDGVDLGLFIDGLVATGQEREVPLAWALFGEGHDHATPSSRLKAVRGLLAARDWRKGLEVLLELTVGSPRRGDEAERAHTARMLAGAPDDVVTSVLGELLDARSTALAWFLARDLGDFWPGAAKSRVVGWGLGKPSAAPTGFRPLELARVDAATREALDAWLTPGAPTLEAADRLVNGWSELVFSGEPVDVTARLAHVAARALEQYLRLSLGAPSPLCGAFRTIAAEALQGLSRRREHLDVSMARAVLELLEPLWPLVHPRLAARWLSFVDHAVGLEELTHGRLGRLLDALPETDARLLTPERLALATRALGQRFREKADGWAAEVARLGETLAWATGNTGAAEWANAVVALQADEELHEDDALSHLQAAAFLTRGFNAEPSVLAAQALFAAHEGEIAFLVLCHGLQQAGEEYRDKALAQLKAPFTAAKLGVPFDFQKAANAAFQAMQKSEPVKAERAGRWCLAQDSDNGEVARNLGLALAAQGRVPEALAMLVRATPEQATQILAGVLYQAGKLPEALAIIDFASRWYVRADQWLTYGGIVYAAMDNPRTVKAYATAWQLDPDGFDTSQLNAWAGVLDEVGDAAMCEVIARRLIDAAGKDLMWLTNGWNHLACALIGKGEYDEAVKWATKAVKQNPLPDNTENFAKTLERAKKKQKLEVQAVPPAEPPRHQAYLLAEAQEHAQALTHLTSDDWHARRAALRSARFRYGSDNHTPVTKAARDAAATVLEQSTAQTAPLATVCRAFALELRAQGLDCAIDRPPDLGDRLTRHAFYEEFRARGGVIVGDVPELVPTFEDRELFAGKPIARASDYVALLEALAQKPFADALAERELDRDGYREVCDRWGQALDKDPALRKLIAAGLA
jgi:tetratricopeptide (TPR) repeat protein